MNNKRIDNEIISLLSKTFFLDPQDINEHTKMEDVNNWDSLKHMSLIFELEDYFKVKFTGEEIVEMNSFNSIKNCILKKR